MTNLKAKHLGKISGLCACTSRETLNGRGYDEIYKGILAGENYRYNEMMKRGGILCEFGHPPQQTADFERTETDPEKACALITKLGKRTDGTVFVDEAIVLDTPAGRIFNAIRPFYQFGFSSRGSYEADPESSEGPDGWNQASYVFKGFDIVALPANEGSKISATESVGSGKHVKAKLPQFKSAREALDINQIADATSVDPAEVTAELDKIFNTEGNIEPAELISVKDFVEEGAQVGVPKEQSNILLDLHRVMVDKVGLEKQIQKLLFEKADVDASLIALREQNLQLKAVQEKAESEIAFYLKNKEEIQALLDKLLSTHTDFAQESDAALGKAQNVSASLAAQVASLKSDIAKTKDEASALFDQAQRAETAEAASASAQEQIKRLTIANETLQAAEHITAAKHKKAVEDLAAANVHLEQATKTARLHQLEVQAAKEALVDTYATLYSVSPQQLIAKVGAKATVAAIRSAAEGLSRDAVRLSAYSVAAPAAARLVTAAPAAPLNDAIEAELFEGLALDGREERRE